MLNILREYTATNTRSIVCRQINDNTGRKV